MKYDLFLDATTIFQAMHVKKSAQSYLHILLLEDKLLPILNHGNASYRLEQGEMLLGWHKPAQARQAHSFSQYCRCGICHFLG